MKKILFTAVIMGSAATQLLQAQQLNADSCIAAALRNKNSLKSIKQDQVIANLKTKEINAKYWPQLSLAYEYRYNPIIQTSILPIGQFNATPTDEKRAVQFGTAWQQSAGATLYQPLIDATINSMAAESKLNERLKNMETTAANRALKYEALSTFTNICQKQRQIAAAIIDTQRTIKTIALTTAKYKEGKILGTDVNKAQQNHNNAVGAYRLAVADYVKQKIYLSYLTGLPLQQILRIELDEQSLDRYRFIEKSELINYDSLPDVQRLVLKQELNEKQRITENKKGLPIVGLQAFLGANQYSSVFNPVLADSWFGNSYVGVTIKWPILNGANRINHLRQLDAEQLAFSYQLEDERRKTNADLQTTIEDIKYLESAVKTLESNTKLLKNNIGIYQERFSMGQATAYDLNNEELALQKEEAQLYASLMALAQKNIEALKTAGY